MTLNQAAARAEDADLAAAITDAEVPAAADTAIAAARAATAAAAVDMEAVEIAGRGAKINGAGRRVADRMIVRIDQIAVLRLMIVSRTIAARRCR